MKKKILSLIMVGLLSATMVACGGDSKDNSKNSGSQIEVNNDVSLSKVHEAIKDAYGESYIPNMPYDEGQIEEVFGVNADLYEEAIAEGPMMSTHSDTLVAIKAKKGKADEVETALKNYQKNLMEDTMQYPLNQIKIKASKVEKFDNYVFFILLGEIPVSAEEKGEEAILKEAEKQNDIAIEAIKSTLSK